VFPIKGARRWKVSKEICPFSTEICNLPNSAVWCRTTRQLLCVVLSVIRKLTADPSGRAVCGRSLHGIAGSNTSGDMDVCLFLSVVCCQVEVSVLG
jgi:hypothetical protein